MIRTIARKERCTCSTVRKRYAITVDRKDGHGKRQILGVDRTNRPPVVYFDRSIVFVRTACDVPKDKDEEFSKELRLRLKSNTCEVCGSHERIQVHHVRNLGNTISAYESKNKDLPDWVRLMLRMNRKTLVVCEKCHKALHNGRLKIPEERLGSGLRGNVHGPF